MKTIEEAANEYAKKIGGDNFHKEELENAFESGIEFAQRWIPVEEELPKRNKWVIVRKHNGLKLGMYFNNVDKFLYGFDDQTSQITHWRPIELS